MGDEVRPSGVVTFLFTDIEGSTRRWEADPDAMRKALADHDDVLATAVAGCGGWMFKHTGDGVCAAFASPSAAVDAAVAAQQTLELPVRMGISTGEAECRADDYFGPALNRTARIMDAGHGGQILVSETTVGLADGTLSDGLELLDLGMHRLRDLGEPDRLFQVAHSDLETDFPPLKTLDATPGNLPIQVSSFVGRDDTLSKVVDALGRSRMVTLVGVGGVGKTTLALRAAADVETQFGGGAWLCELASVRDPDRVTEAVAGVFGVSVHPGGSLLDSLIGFLRDEELLLVLDNCEHLLDSAADVVAAIEGACAKVSVLATSREGFGVPGEQVLVVNPLAVPDIDSDPTEIDESPAVELFVDRARAHRADFEIDDSNRANVTALCQRLDGIPLALELAAARISMMNSAEILERLDRRFKLLAGNRGGIDRHQTLGAAVDWSYDLLTETEQNLLARLSVFAGGWTMQAAESVCTDDLVHPDDVLDLLASLVSRSLVVPERAAETRYLMLETIRQYAADRLAQTGEEAQWRSRHLDYYIDTITDCVDELWGPGQIEASDRLELEQDNFSTAMAFALEEQDVDRAMALLLPSNTSAISAVLGEGWRFDPAPVLALPGVKGHPCEPRALLVGATAALTAGDSNRAEEMMAEAEEAQARLGFEDDVFRRERTTGLSVLTGALGEIETAEHLLDEAADLGEATGAPLGQIATMRAFAVTWAAGSAESDPKEVRGRAEEALDIAQRSGMPSAIAMSKRVLADVLVPLDPERANALLRETTDMPHVQHLLTTAFTAARLSDWELATGVGGEAIRLNRRGQEISPLNLTGLMNIVARGLVEPAPEGAARLQGAAGKLLREFIEQLPDAGVLAESGSLNAAAEAAASARREASGLLVETLGDERWRELKAEGSTLTRDESLRLADQLTQQAALG